MGVQLSILNKLELVYGKNSAIGASVQGYGEAIRTMKKITRSTMNHNQLQLQEIWLQNIKDLHYLKIRLQKRKKPMTTSDVGMQLAEINAAFRTLMEGFTCNFETIANAMVEENMPEKVASERMKDAIEELTNLSLPSADVFKVVDIFTADKDKIDVFLNLPSHLRLHYVLSLLVPSSGN